MTPELEVKLRELVAIDPDDYQEGVRDFAIQQKALAMAVIGLYFYGVNNDKHDRDNIMRELAYALAAMKPTAEQPATVTPCDCEYCVRINWYSIKLCMPPLDAYGRQHLVYAGAHGFCLARYGSNGNGKPTWFFHGTSARTEDVTHWKFISPPAMPKPKRKKGKR